MSSEDITSSLNSSPSDVPLPIALTASTETEKRRKVAYEKPDYKRVLSEIELKDELKIYYGK